MQKQEKIVQMFNQIAPSYDKANRILSFGIDTKWREDAIKKVQKYINKDNLVIVDVACGTADMCALLKKLKHTKLIGIDPSEGMLKIAKKRFSDVEFKQAYATALGLDDASVDLITISFGFRNVVEKQQALKEFKRVLKKDGILLILEFFKREKGGFIATIRDFYLKNILPKLGALISKNKQAYKYLPNSIDDFYSNNEFKKELKQFNLELLEFKTYSFGVSSLFIIKK